MRRTRSRTRRRTPERQPRVAPRAAGLVPELPREVGVEHLELDITDVEGARLLANEARPVLAAEGFTNDEIREWAEAYFVQHHEGDVGELIAWIRRRERLDDPTDQSAVGSPRNAATR